MNILPQHHGPSLEHFVMRSDLVFF